MAAMRFGLAISQEGPEPQSLGAIESILLIGCLHKMRSHLAEDPSFQSLTRKIHGSSMDFPSERGKNIAMAMSGSNGRRSLDLQCLDGSFFGALQLSVCVTWINDLEFPAVPGGAWRIGHWPQNPHISMRKNDDHPWVYGIAGILVEAFPLRCSTCSTCPEGSPNRRGNFALSTMQLAKLLVGLKYGYPQVTMGFNAEMVWLWWFWGVPPF